MTREKKSLAPILRGLAFDGEKGPFVVTRRGGKAPEGPGVLTLEGAAGVSPEAAWDEFVRRGRGLPGAVVLPPADGEKLVTYFLGRDYGEAAAGAEAAEINPLCRIPGSSARGDVVRSKIAVVTGGAQGFGAGIVRGLTAEGAFVFIADRNLAGAAALAEELKAGNPAAAALPVEVNVADEDSVEAMVSQVVERAGGIDLFINNAGVLKAGGVKELSLKNFNFVTSVNYTGYFLCVKHAAPVMAAQSRAARGRYSSDIIQINSKSGLEGSNKNGAYAGGKFGGIGLTQSFALELIADGIKVNAVCPGNFFDGPLWSDPERGLFVQYLKTGKVPGAKTIAEVRAFYEGKVPMGRGCEAEDILRAILYLVEQKYETGQAVPVTGGQVMLN